MLLGLMMVGRTLTSSRTRRRISILLLLALFPMLTFMGHWPAAVHIPGTDQYLSIPLAGNDEPADEHDDGHSHSQHCHGNSGSCSDVPALAGVSFALMSEALALSVTAALVWAVAFHCWQPRRPNSLLPELQPPRPAYA